ncbi:MAG TPA: DEAD/DEAH box helicase [Candidatus Omnitrophota bacterium]|nr:DEAD/DEAH box helicase [Candidatus Omnitrophota bacterium]
MIKTQNPLEKMASPALSFYGLGIAPKIMEIIAQLKFTNATPIQHKAIPIALEGKDFIGIAQTGTGKTMAFAIPTVQNLAKGQSSALILVPTRELALQVEESISKIARSFAMKSVVLIGGAPIHAQIRSLKQQPRILIATPGRLIDLMQQRKVQLNKIGILVLDEADRMLDMGFAPQIERILKEVSVKRQTMLFSATMPSAIVTIATAHMKFPVQVEIAPPGTSAEDVSHELFIVPREKKQEILKDLLQKYRGSILLFCRTKIGTQKLARALRNLGHKAAEIHSDRSLSQRKDALEGFRKGRYRILAATDIASRGIDVAGIELVINYDLPEDPENYVHRIGRTGRAGMAGHAVSFASPDQRQDVQNIERLMKMTIPISVHPDGTVAQFDKPRNVFSGRKMPGRRKISFRGRGRR